MFGDNQEQLTVDLYIRVSTEKQATQGDSLEEQEAELKKYCEFRNFKIHRIYIEKGRSAKNTDRPEYQKMLKDITGKKIDAIVVKKLDRLSRSLLDFEQLLLTLQTYEVAFISLKEQFDTSNAMGQAMIKITMVFAELERRQISERVSDTMIYRASQGLFNGGMPPFGYTNANKELVPYPREKLVVEIMYDQFLINKSCTETARFLNNAGYRYRKDKPWDKRWIYKILRTPVYTGKVPWKGEVYQGIHQAIITEKKFNSIQDIFNERKLFTRKSKTNALLQKIIYCGQCKVYMTPIYAYNWQKNKYYYYRCSSTEKKNSNCNMKYIAFDKAQKTIINILLSLSTEIGFMPVEQQISKHNENVSRDLKVIRLKLDELEIKLADVKSRKDRYLDSLITGEFSSKERTRINVHLDALEIEEKQTNSAWYKAKFEYDQKTEEQINSTAIKAYFISFKADYDYLQPKQLRDRIRQLVDRYYFGKECVLDFKVLPWSMTFKNSSS